LGGSLASLAGRPADPKLNVPSAFTSTAALVLGQNNVIVWSRTVDRLAAAVTEECPYSIEIVEPKVPLVRSGSMGLKVRANRKPGFKSAISIYHRASSQARQGGAVSCRFWVSEMQSESSFPSGSTALPARHRTFWIRTPSR